MKRLFIIFTIAYWGIAEAIAITSGSEANRLMTDPMAHGINPAGASALHQVSSHLHVYSTAIPIFAALLLFRFAFRWLHKRNLKIGSQVGIPLE